MAFSQRRYNGFRGQVEFDKKRIVVSGKQEFSIFGYENFMSDENYELLHLVLPPDEEIQFVEFIEDIVPKYLFLIIKNTKTKQTNLYIKLIKKNNQYFEDKKSDSASVKYETNQSFATAPKDLRA